MIPLATTTVTLRGIRPQPTVDPDAEGYDGPAPSLTDLATGIRATITLPVGRRSNPTDEIDSYVMRCDLIDGVEPSRNDVVIDETSGQGYYIHTAVKSLPEDFDLSHWILVIKLTKGIVESGDFDEFARE